MALEVHVSKTLGGFALDVRFTAPDAPLSILGPSGAGKTLLLRSIAGLETPARGRIVLGGRTVFDSERKINVPARDRRVGMLFQHYALFPHRTVTQNIAFGLGRMPRAERESRVAGFLQRMHLGGLGTRYPRELSGGEQQRAALARALAIGPEALLLDEPLSALDTHLRSQMEAQLQETFAAFRKPALLVTHNIEEAYRLGGQLLVLSRGRIAAFGAKEDIFREPPTVEVARLTGCKNFSRAAAISAHRVEATDWRCVLETGREIGSGTAYAGIRAHHLEFPESAGDGGAENVFPCWLARSSETPFRTTLYLKLHEPAAENGAYDLQAEVSREKWQKLRDRPFPWRVRIAPEALFVMPE